MTFDTFLLLDPTPLAPGISHHATGNLLSSYPKWTGWSATCSRFQHRQMAFGISTQISKSLALCDHSWVSIITLSVFDT